MVGVAVPPFPFTSVQGQNGAPFFCAQTGEPQVPRLRFTPLGMTILKIGELWILFAQLIAGEFRNAEVAAQMKQIEGAEGSVDGDEINVGGTGEHHHCAFDIGMLEAYPYIGAALIVGVMSSLRGDHVLPAAVAILLADGFEAGRVVETGRGKFIAVHGNAVQFGDDAARVLIFDEVVGQCEHGAVEGEIGAERGVLADGVHVVRNPGVVLSVKTDGKQKGGQKGEGDE